MDASKYAVYAVTMEEYIPGGIYRLDRNAALHLLKGATPEHVVGVSTEEANQKKAIQAQADHLASLVRSQMGEQAGDPMYSGLRFDADKPRYDLIPHEFMNALATHFLHGTKKYPDRNWEKGMRWGTCFRAMMSHAWKWFGGETYDVDPKMPEYKAHHLIAVAWNAMALYTYETRKIGHDDRVVTFQETLATERNLPHGM
jgi:Domain of unknown function (DUF5664)